MKNPDISIPSPEDWKKREKTDKEGSSQPSGGQERAAPPKAPEKTGCQIPTAPREAAAFAGKESRPQNGGAGKKKSGSRMVWVLLTGSLLANLAQCVAFYGKIEESKGSPDVRVSRELFEMGKRLERMEHSQTQALKNHSTGYAQGFADGQKEEYDKGVAVGEKTGYAQGFTEGQKGEYEKGVAVGEKTGYARGLAQGRKTAASTQSTAKPAANPQQAQSSAIHIMSGTLGSDLIQWFGNPLQIEELDFDKARWKYTGCTFTLEADYKATYSVVAFNGDLQGLIRKSGGQ